MIIKLCEIIFWISFFIVVYSYTIYPVLLILFVRLFGKPIKGDSSYLPEIGVLVPAHNEEKVIRTKIDNILAIDYPKDKVSIWVGSDCSTDATETIVKSHPDPRVHLWISPVRGGKTGVINQLAPRIDTEILLFTDANTMHRPDCLLELVKNFADKRVGGVAGHIEHIKSGDDETGEGVYRAFESRQKYHEGILHSAISAFGGFYAVRKNVFFPIPSNAYSNDDVLIPMNVIRQGFRVIYEPNSISEEDMAGSTKNEFNRRIRIGAGNFQAFFWLLDFINPMKGWPAFCLVSHKFTRWFSPLFILCAVISCSILVFYSSSEIYRIFFASGTIILTAGLCHKIIPLRISKHVFYFITMNTALILGFIRYISGIKSATWSRTERYV